MSEPQFKKRVRKRSVALMLQEALNAAAALENLEPTELSIARMKLAQTRLNILLQMQARERHDKLKEATDALAKSEAENARLREENTRLQQERPARYRDAEIAEALARYEEEKRCTR
jgi:hypothetical protein